MTTDIEKIVSQMVEVQLPDTQSFLKIRETLRRIGVANKENKLFQSCHILQKRGKYYIVHFKELFMLDGKEADFSEEDKGRRNQIANLLAGWSLLILVDPEKTKAPLTPISKIKVLKYDKDFTVDDKTDEIVRKDGWRLISKYRIGNKTKRVQPVVAPPVTV
jgi:hypothetical protein